jgi:hypothetical protein
LPVGTIIVEPPEPLWPVLAPPDMLTGCRLVDEVALGELVEVPAVLLAAGVFAEIPAAGLVLAVVPVGSVPVPVPMVVPVPVPGLLVDVLEPVDESVPSSGGAGTAVGSDIEEALVELPSTGPPAGVGALCGWSAADLIV